MKTPQTDAQKLKALRKTLRGVREKNTKLREENDALRLDQKTIQAENPDPALPLPRLELEWTINRRDSAGHPCDWTVVYRMILPHMRGFVVRHVMEISGGYGTRGDGVLPRVNGDRCSDMPLVCGCHAAFDAGVLGLPVYVRGGTLPAPVRVDITKSHPDQYARGLAQRTAPRG